MNNNKIVSITLAKDKIDKMISFYSGHIVPNNNVNVAYFIKKENLSITIYKSNKVVFQGKNATYESKIWKSQDLNLTWSNIGEQIGSDEVGTGDYFGPLCVCGAFLSQTDAKWFLKLDVGDSKNISDKKIKILAPMLIKKLTYSQISISPSKYNSLIKQGLNQAQIKAILHNQVLLNVLKKIDKKDIPLYVDKFVSEKKYFEYLKDKKEVLTNIIAETKAEDKFPSVAAASIIARYAFLNKMEKMSKELSLTVPKGACTKVDSFGKKIYDEKGIDFLGKYAKIHFSNTKRIVNTD